MPVVSDQVVILTRAELEAAKDDAFQRGVRRGIIEAQSGRFYDLPLQLGARVEKTGGDYRFSGEVMSGFRKRNGRSIRFVVENDDGILHIFGDGQLSLIDHYLPPVTEVVKPT